MYMQILRTITTKACTRLVMGMMMAVAMVAPVQGQVVISQVFGGGASAGATYTNDFIEIFNRGPSSQSVNGWSVQYASSGGTTWAAVALPNVNLQPGQYLLVQMGGTTSGALALPTPDATSGTGMSATAGKVLLASTTTAQSGANPTGAAILDKVSYGSASDSTEGTPTTNLSVTTAAIRNSSGCVDTNANSVDFTISTPSPRNTSTARNICTVSDGTNYGANPSNATIGTSEYGPNNAYRWTGGGTGFGGPLGGGSIYLKSDPANLYIGVQFGASTLGGNVIVILLDSTAGGFTFAPTGGGDTQAIGRMLTNTTLPSGFSADYALAIRSNGQQLYQLGSGGATTIFSENYGTTDAANTTREIRIPYVNLAPAPGLTPGSTVRFVAGLASNTAFLSNESIPPSSAFNAATNPGNTPATGAYVSAASFTTIGFTPSLVTTRTDASLTGATVNGVLGANEYGPSNGYSFSGAGNGFGGTVGGATVYMKSDFTNLYIGFQPGGTALDNVAVLYLRTKTGGFTDGTMGDLTTSDRSVVSDLTLNPDDGFPFLANYAISIWNSGAGAFLYELQGTGTNHTFISNAGIQIGSGGTGGVGFRELVIPLSTLGMSPGGNVDFFMGYCSTTRSNSNESIPAYSPLNSASNPATNGPTAGYGTYHRFVTTACTPITIDGQPASSTSACVGSNLILTVNVSGNGPAFQWRRGTTNLNTGDLGGRVNVVSSASFSTLTISGLLASDAASNYNVVVTGTCGNATSNNAALTVAPQPGGTASASGSTIYAGQTINLLGSLTNTPGFAWSASGGSGTFAPVSGTGTNPAATFTLTSGTIGNTVTLSVSGTGVAPCTGSYVIASIPLTIVAVPCVPVALTNFSVSPSGTVCAGTGVTFSASATGDGPITYIFRRGGTPVQSGTSPTYTIASAAAADAGSYTVEVTNACGNQASSAIPLTVNPTTVITGQPSSATVCETTPASFTVTATGVGLSYQWRFNGAPIGGATSATYTIASTVGANAGSYDCVVTGTCGTETSSAASLTVNPTTVITGQPTSVTVCEGLPAAFSVTATGDGLTYQWRRNTTPIGGATSPTFTIASAVAADAGSYDCVVTGTCGTETTSPATLIVNPQPVAPTGASVDNPTVCSVGGPATILLTAIGGSGTTLEWFTGSCGGTPVGTGNPLSIPTPVSNTTYYARWTNSCGSSGCASVGVSIQPAPTVSAGSSPSVTVCAALGVVLNGSSNDTASVLWTSSGTGTFSNPTGVSGTYSFSTADVLAGTVILTLTGQPIAPCAGPATSTLTVTISPPPLAVFVDDDYAANSLPNGTPVNFPYDGNPGPYTIGCDAFGSVQGGVNGAVSGGTVNVAAGTYLGLISLNKPVTLLGANAGVCADGSVVRGPESLLLPGVSNALDGILLYVTASGVTIDGFALEGDNGVPGDGQPAFEPGTEADVGNIVANGSFDDTGPYPFVHVRAVSVLNNVIRSANDVAVNLYNDGSDPVSDQNAIVCNSFTNIAGDNTLSPGGPYSRVGVLLYNDTYASVDQNILGTAISPVNIGVQTGNNYRPLAAGGASMNGNTAVVQTVALYHNLHYQNSSPWTMIGNTISPATGSGGDSVGISLWSLSGNASVSVLGNTLTGLGRGIEMWNVDPTSPVTITGDTIDSCGTGIEATNWNALYGSGPASAVISGESVIGCANGVVALDTPDNVPPATQNPGSPPPTQPVRLSIDGSTVSGGSVGVESIGPSAGVIVRYSGISGTSIGLDAQGGAAVVEYTDLTGSGSEAVRVIDGAKVDLGQCGPVAADITGLGTGSLGGNTLTGYGFDGAFPFAIVNSNTSAQPDVSAANNSYYTGPAQDIAQVILVQSGGSNVLYKQTGGAPVFTAQPSSASVCSGLSTTFTAAGFNYASLQWRKDGIDLPGEVSLTLTINPVGVGDAGVYDLVATDVCGVTTTSDGATLTVLSPPSITLEPVGQADCAGNPVTFSVVATDAAGYQWRKDGVPILGATGPSYTIIATTLADVGSYDVVVSGGCGSVTSAAASLIVNPNTAIITPPTGGTFCAGGSVVLNVGAAGSGLTYQWRRNTLPLVNGGAISGANAPTLTINPAATGDSGSYDVVVSGVCGTVTSSPVSVTVNAATAIVSQPTGANLCEGSTFNTSVTASGVGLLYQWKKNGVPVGGATAPSFSIASVTPADAGSYTVEVTGTCGTVTSDPGVLAVQPDAVANAGGPYSGCASSPVSVTGTASGYTTLAWTTTGDGVFTNPSALSTIYTPGPTDSFGGTIFVTLTATAIAPCTASASSTTTITINPPPAIVSVDDGYVGLPSGTSVDFPYTGAPGPYTIGCDAFAAIQPALNAATSGATVNVAPGLYPGSLVVSKPVSLVGPNATVCAKTSLANSRNPESVIRPTLSNALDGILIYITSSNVSINGFTLDGDNQVPGDGQPVSGGEADTGNIIANGSFDDTIGKPFVHVDHVSIVNNIIRAANDVGINLYNEGSQPVSDFNGITCNAFSDFNGFNTISPGGPYSRIVVLLYNDTYANVDDNSFLNFRIGVQTGNNSRPNAGPGASISNNDLTTFDSVGLWHNLHYGAASNWAIDFNTVAASTSGVVPNAYGVFISSVFGGVTASATNNQVFNCGTGIGIWNVPATTPIQINGGLLAGNTVGVDFYNNDADFGDGDSGSVVLFGMTLNGNGTGVRLFDTPGDDPLSATVRGTLRIDASNMTVVGHTTGFSVQGGRASLNLLNSASVLGNTLGVDVDTGKARIESTTITGSSLAGIRSANGAIVDAGQCSGSGTDVTGLGISSGGNTLTGYVFDGLAPFAIVNLNASGGPNVLAYNNLYGAGTGDDLELAFSGNGGAYSAILYSQAGGPIITTQPIAVSTCSGTNATFTVVAYGQFTYQWQKNGVPIFGATGASYTIFGVTPADAGSYDVVVSDTCSNDLSSDSVSLTVNEAPVFTLQPVDLSTCPGGSVTFSSNASGVPTPDFQWYFNGNPITGATSSSYTIAVATPADVGSYTVQVSNLCGTITSLPASLSLLAVPAPATSASVSPSSYCTGTAPTTITLTASGGSGSTFTWFSDSCGTSSIGTGPVLTIAAPVTTTTYFGRWSTTCGDSSCVSATVTVTPTPTPLTSVSASTPTFCTAAPPSNITLTASGGTGGTITWYSGSCGGSPIGTGSPLVISAPPSTTTYFARREDGSCFSSCLSTTVTVNTSPTAPTSASVDSPVYCSGSVTTITLTATGGSGDSLHWYSASCGGTPVGTGPVLVLAAPTTTTTYFARWESILCGVTSCVSTTVTVNPLPLAPIAITTSTSGYCPGSVASITLTAVGGLGDTLEWFDTSCGSTVIGTGNPLVIPAPVTTTTYYARWTSTLCGSSTCANLPVSVGPISGVCCVGFGSAKTCTIVTQPGGCTGPTTPAQAYRGNCSVCTGPGVICCPGDYNNDGIRSPSDIFDFLNNYFAPTHPFADFNNDGFTQPADIFNLLTSYFAGCN